ncbi:hypothetical protein [Streptomyces canus]|uniref:hypothetical protein n=1 Tax=Streptomyces canus TaxID=58343 RepID=UPI0027D806A6|nr:hypothetical protein [Streptomyces canus]
MDTSVCPGLLTGTGVGDGRALDPALALGVVLAGADDEAGVDAALASVSVASAAVLPPPSKVQPASASTQTTTTAAETLPHTVPPPVDHPSCGVPITESRTPTRKRPHATVTGVPS